MKPVILAWFAIFVGVLACTPRSRSGAPRPPNEELPLIKPEENRIEVTERVKRARALVERFKGRLQSGLRRAIKEGGVVAAIPVCSDMAKETTDATRDGELWLRRVGTRVRNPERGTPTPHEREVLAGMTLMDREHASDDGETFHYMQGIFIDRGTCVICHGREEQIPPEVKAALAEAYPNDPAVGYLEGDLRGAFVVYGRSAPEADASGATPAAAR